VYAATVLLFLISSDELICFWASERLRLDPKRSGKLLWKEISFENDFQWRSFSHG
jgi:hypothetical protein